MQPAEIPRFDRVERFVHWTIATLVGVLIATGACLYLGQIEALVGRRELVRNIHVAAGLSLPVPILLGLVTRAGRGLRRDLGRLNRWSRDDVRWWRRESRGTAQLGKFHPGQKLNATFLGGALVVMLMSGSIMRFFSPFPDSWRTGATSVHDWFALGIGLSVIGHVMLATRDPIAMRAMRAGPVPETWARTHRPRWYAEMVDANDDVSTRPGGSLCGPSASIPSRVREGEACEPDQG
jgi:formate dehydrogenase subunit gamma